MENLRASDHVSNMWWAIAIFVFILIACILGLWWDAHETAKEQRRRDDQAIAQRILREERER